MVPPDKRCDDEAARSVEDFGCGDGDLDAVVGIRVSASARETEPPISRLELPSVNVPEEGSGRWWERHWCLRRRR